MTYWEDIADKLADASGRSSNEADRETIIKAATALRSIEPAPIENLAKHFGVTQEQAKAAIGDLGFLYRELAVPAQGWQEPAADWLIAKADLLTNSLHCGDSSMTIHFTHKHADTLRALAKEIRASSSLPSTGLPAPAPADREKIAKIFAYIWHGDAGEWKGFLSKADAFLAYPSSSLPAPAPHAEVREALAHIDKRLVDLREANEIFKTASWDRSSDILRNDREIRWLIEFRTMLRLPTALALPQSTERGQP